MIVIPTLNERENIPILYNQVKNFDLIVVDGGSTDGTIDILKEYGIPFISLSHGEKSGLGVVLRKGIQYALDSGADHIITIDADLSHNPRDIPRLLAELGHASLVIGSRYVQGGKIVGWGLYRHLMSRTANFLYHALVDRSVKDVTSGFRVYTREAGKTVLGCDTPGYEFQICALTRILKSGQRVAEVPVTFVNREKGRSHLKYIEVYRFVKEVLNDRKIMRSG